jgi:hypothetical protein
VSLHRSGTGFRIFVTQGLCKVHGGRKHAALVNVAALCEFSQRSFDGVETTQFGHEPFIAAVFYEQLPDPLVDREDVSDESTVVARIAWPCFAVKPQRFAAESVELWHVNSAASQANRVAMQYAANMVEVSQLAAAERLDHRTFMMHKFDDARLLQFDQCLANRRGAHTHLERQRVGDQSGPRADFARDNVYQELLYDMVS